MKKLYIGLLASFLIFNAVSYSSIVDVINKIDNAINPEIKFDVDKASGMWYLLYDNDVKTRNLENITVDLAQEGQGYNYITKSYNPKRGAWVKEEKRAWIEEDKENAYFYVRKNGFLNYKNKILYFDNDMNYLVIYFKKENVIRFLTRSESPNTREINEIMAYIKNQGYSVSNLKKISYDSSLRDENELKKIQEEEEFYERLSRFGESGTINFDEAVEIPKN
jgi:lipocalin